MIERSIKITFNFQDIEFPQQIGENSDDDIGIKITISDADGQVSDLFFTEIEQIDEVLSQLYQIKSILKDAKKSSTESTD